MSNVIRCDACPFFVEDDPCRVCHEKLQREYDAMDGTEEE